MSKLSKMKYAVSGFLLGAIFFGSIAFAATSTIDVSFDKLKFIINGVDKTTSDGMFNNQGTKVPSLCFASKKLRMLQRKVENFASPDFDLRLLIR